MVTEGRLILSKSPSNGVLGPPNSPLEKTPHKARNGELTITCRNRHCRTVPDQRPGPVAGRTYRRSSLPVRVCRTWCSRMPHQLCCRSLWPNKRVLYDLLLRTSAATLLGDRGRSQAISGAEIGFHERSAYVGPELCCTIPMSTALIPAGGLAPDESALGSFRATAFFLAREGAQPRVPGQVSRPG